MSVFCLSVSERVSECECACARSFAHRWAFSRVCRVGVRLRLRAGCVLRASWFVLIVCVYFACVCFACVLRLMCVLRVRACLVAWLGLVSVLRLCLSVGDAQCLECLLDACALFFFVQAFG